MFQSTNQCLMDLRISLNISKPRAADDWIKLNQKILSSQGPSKRGTGTSSQLSGPDPIASVAPQFDGEHVAPHFLTHDGSVNVCHNHGVPFTIKKYPSHVSASIYHTYGSVMGMEVSMGVSKNIQKWMVVVGKISINGWWHSGYPFF